MPDYLVDADADFTVPFLLAVSDVPTDADALPPFRVLGADAGQIGSGTGALAETGVVTGCTAANPPEVTSVAHGLATGCVVTTSGIGGLTGVTGTFTVTVTGANTFTLNGATGVGAYTSGGAWHTTGLYLLTFDGTLRAALEAGETYPVHVYPAVSAVTKAKDFTIQVK